MYFPFFDAKEKQFTDLFLFAEDNVWSTSCQK